MSRFLSEKLHKLEAYTPGEQPKDFKYIKLNTNESPYPPSPAAMARVDGEELCNLRLYPDPECSQTVEAIADYYGIKPQNILLGNGSDELLSFFFMGFCGKGVVFPDISYGFYSVYAELYGAQYKKIPLRNDFTVNVDDYCSVGKSVVIANPNAPTGIALSVYEIERILKTNPDNIVLVDEAYVDFGAESCVDLIKKYDNLLVVQTYSKSRSLAGARLGFAMASQEIIHDMHKIKYSINPYNINRLTLILGEEAVRDKTYFEECRKKIIDAREYAERELKKLGFVMTESKSNFLFASHPMIGGFEFYKALRSEGILVRHFQKPRISEYLRITVGTPDDMRSLVDAAKKILNGGKK